MDKIKIPEPVSYDEQEQEGIPVESLEILLIKSNIELLQRVNKLIELLEKNG